MLTVVPGYVTRAVKVWIDKLDKSLDSPMTENDRKNNTESVTEYALRYNKMPDMEETLRQIKTSKDTNTSKGCGKKQTRYSQVEHCWKDCGEKFNSGMLILCKECSESNGKTKEEENEQ